MLKAQDLRGNAGPGPVPSAEVALIVPTTYDAHILRAKPTLPLGPAIGGQGGPVGLSLTVLPNSSFYTPDGPATERTSRSSANADSPQQQQQQQQLQQKPLHSPSGSARGLFVDTSAPGPSTEGSSGSECDSEADLAATKATRHGPPPKQAATAAPPAATATTTGETTTSDSEEWWHSVSSTPRAPSGPSGVVELRDASVAALFASLAKWGHVAMVRAEVVQNASQRWEIHVLGHNPDGLSASIKRIDDLVAQANKHSESQPLAEWSAQHVLAIVGSAPFLKVLRECSAAAVFATSDKSKPAGRKDKAHQQEDSSKAVVVASICALDSKGLGGVRDFLADLYPKRSSWRCPVPVPTQAQLCVFSVFAETSPEQPDPSGHIELLNVWGFGSLLNHAHEELVEKRGGQSPSAGSAQGQGSGMRLGLGLGPGSGTQVGMRQLPQVGASSPSASKSAASMFPSPGTLVALSPPSSSGKHKSSFTFQDREAGVFYQAFEAEFRAFLKDMGVDVVTTESSPADSPQWKGSLTGGGGGSSGGGSGDKGGSFDVRAPAVKVIISGSSAKDVAAGKAVFDSLLNTAHLARCQITFPRTSVEKYKELLVFKQMKDKALRGIREASLASEAAKASHSQPQQHQQSRQRHSNPMHCEGFVNIRIKPPLHSRGIK